ncbi:unnamed protein product, partial [Coregonus sp. 'balchen']
VPGDGEELFAHLVKRGTVDAVASEDMDTAPLVATEVIAYSLPKLLDIPKITHEEVRPPEAFVMNES